MKKYIKKVAVIISGCGNRDGGEIHETTLALLELDKAGFEAVCFAPNKDQADVIDFVTGKTMNEKRNVLQESARIARGKIRDLKEFNSSEVDALVIPGGMGAAKNLCDFALKGENCTVDKDVEKAILEMFKLHKPICAICIAPVVVAKVLGKEKVKLTIGNDKETAEKIEKMGCIHENCEVQNACIDVKNKIISTPAYMLAKSISDVDAGIVDMIRKLEEIV